MCSRTGGGSTLREASSSRLFGCSASHRKQGRSAYSLRCRYRCVLFPVSASHRLRGACKASGVPRHGIYSALDLVVLFNSAGNGCQDHAEAYEFSRHGYYMAVMRFGAGASAEAKISRPGAMTLFKSASHSSRHAHTTHSNHRSSCITYCIGFGQFLHAASTIMHDDIDTRDHGF